MIKMFSKGIKKKFRIMNHLKTFLRYVINRQHEPVA